MRNALLFLLLFAQILSAQGPTLERLDIPVFQNGSPLPFAFAGGLNNPQFSAADLNNDGVDDLVVFDRAGDVVLTFLNGGTPGQLSYSFAPEYAAHFPALKNYALLRDYNQDGAADIFCASLAPGTQEMQVFTGYFEQNVLKFRPFKFHYPNCPNCSPDLVYYPDTDQPGFWNNLSIASTDLPDVNDVDGDGDLDILTFDPAGGHVWFVRNRSVELGFGTDSLRFQVLDKCWGRFYESGLLPCKSDLSPDLTTCQNGLLGGAVEERDGLHPGSTLLTFDQNGDGDMEILLGDVSFDCLNLLFNGGSAAQAWMTAQDETFPSYDTPVLQSVFPAAFYLDVDNDGRRDLLASPNNRNIGEDQKNVWHYRNTGTGTTQTFTLQGKSLFTGDMIDLGTISHPAFADVNADGLLDLVVGTYGFFQPQFPTNARLFLFLNIGTATAPQFNLTNSDWLGFSEFAPEDYDFAPAFGDLDADGDLDLLVGNNIGGFYCYRNNAGPGNPLALTRDFNPMWSNMDVVGISSTPLLRDFNDDGLVDILSGERSGNLNLFLNTGTPGSPLFPATPTIQKIGAVDTRLPGESVGYSAPALLQTPQGLLLVTGTNAGHLEAYTGIGVANDTFLLSDARWGNVDEGNRSHPAFADLDGDGFLEMVCGNTRGGLGLYRTNYGTVSVETPALAERRPLALQVAPNPVQDRLRVEVLEAHHQLLNWQIFNTLGQCVAQGENSDGNFWIPTATWQPGLYLLQARSAGRSASIKVVKN
jgi:hypothetical protein